MQKETYWSRFAKDFEQRNIYVIGRSDLDLVRNKISSLTSLGNVLELACGDGVYSRILAKNAASLLATDFSDEMVDSAKSNLVAFNNVSVEKANCFSLSYPDDSFDSVFMANLVHIIPHPEKALEEAGRVLKQNGKLIVVSFTMDGMKFFHKVGMIFRYLKTYGKPPRDGRTLTQEDANKLVRLAGFEVNESELIGEKCKAVFLISDLVK
jgi:ubiquinone/menaquinone biosynthesis C-methylase UbiE